MSGDIIDFTRRRQEQLSDALTQAELDRLPRMPLELPGSSFVDGRLRTTTDGLVGKLFFTKEAEPYIIIVPPSAIQYE